MPLDESRPLADGHLKTKTRQVMNLRAGQRFIWCGRVVTFLHAQDHYSTKRKKHRRLIVSDGQLTHALWYEDRESVTLVIVRRDREMWTFDRR